MRQAKLSDGTRDGDQRGSSTVSNLVQFRLGVSGVEFTCEDDSVPDRDLECRCSPRGRKLLLSGWV